MLTGPELLQRARHAHAELTQHAAELNALNVFPIADGDTGDNMLATMAAALQAADAATAAASAAGATPSAPEVARALATGAVRGARGNSGMVLSQVLRAVAEAVVEGHDPAAGLARSVEFVTEALADPVEGTGLSVLRAAATAPAGAPLAAADHALRDTARQLPALGGRIDAGAWGLVLVLKALLGPDTLDPTTGGAAGAAGQRTPEAWTSHAPHAGQAYLEVMFYFQGAEETIQRLEQALCAMGQALVVARTGDSAAQVHIHTHQAGRVIEEAFGLGEVSDIRIEVLPLTQRPALVAAAPRGSVARLFAEAGAEVIDPGQRPRPDAIYLPNGLGHTAQEDSQLVVPTESLVEGIAAVAVFNPQLPAAQAAAVMRETAAGVRVARVEDVDKLDATARGLLRPGDELMTILVRPDVAVELSDLGVETTVYPADNLDSVAQIGVE
ncbi:DAK2 domain-containing protein [Corynebacterium uberis]|uniref:DAK2 domain-containing protein n=1 Tax=Corynebacterium TaxID=1716 RepID=UPI001D0BB2C2|nr:DAK2 domain-containing protein [Corynebacterium uberis]MCZ9309136.1 DAK2 domain-containing protein [Corynebacterium sp. c6VSa_13]UDL76764.1 DAK2 domain-containing protein [Corynebacterium uberis]UDL78977.1 DAK2 domain-containing protein [Corynebacterium uberis]UDL81254.1 DAK2 domain-containing protein [Corynebacterium uberis]UDL85600.1 DAK2 domain-containing protein [Corynebacterium uberis]